MSESNGKDVSVAPGENESETTKERRKRQILELYIVRKYRVRDVKAMIGVEDGTFYELLREIRQDAARQVALETRVGDGKIVTALVDALRGTNSRINLIWEQYHTLQPIDTQELPMTNFDRALFAKTRVAFLRQIKEEEEHYLNLLERFGLITSMAGQLGGGFSIKDLIEITRSIGAIVTEEIADVEVKRRIKGRIEGAGRVWSSKHLLEAEALDVTPPTTRE